MSSQSTPSPSDQLLDDSTKKLRNILLALMAASAFEFISFWVLKKDPSSYYAELFSFFSAVISIYATWRLCFLSNISWFVKICAGALCISMIQSFMPMPSKLYAERYYVIYRDFLKVKMCFIMVLWPICMAWLTVNKRKAGARLLFILLLVCSFFVCRSVFWNSYKEFEVEIRLTYWAIMFIGTWVLYLSLGKDLIHDQQASVPKAQASVPKAQASVPKAQASVPKEVEEPPLDHNEKDLSLETSNEEDWFLEILNEEDSSQETSNDEDDQENYQEICYQPTFGRFIRAPLVFFVQAVFAILLVFCILFSTEETIPGLVFSAGALFFNVIIYKYLFKTQFPPLRLSVSKDGLKCNKITPDTIPWHEIYDIEYDLTTNTFLFIPVMTYAKVKIIKRDLKKQKLMLYFGNAEDAQMCCLTIQMYYLKFRKVEPW